MRKLTEEEDARAAALHAQSLVVDPLCTWGPVFADDTLLNKLESMADNGAAGGPLLTALRDANVESLIAGTAQDYWSQWQMSGVNVISATVGWFGPEIGQTFVNAKQDLERWSKLFEFVERIALVKSADDIRSAWRSSDQGVILNLQDTTAFGTDLAILHELLDFGITQVELAYGPCNHVGSGGTEPNPVGLTEFGKNVVRTLNERRSFIEISHCSARTSLDAVEFSNSPVALTHTYAHAVYPTPRAQTDDVIRAVGASGGYVGVSLAPFFLSPGKTATLDDFMRHFDHILAIVGEKRIGIGSDWGPPGFPGVVVDSLNREMEVLGWQAKDRFDWGATPIGFSSWSDWPNITRTLVAAGFPDEQIRGFLGENFTAYYAAVVG